MTGPSFAAVYRKVCREALATELQRSADWRRDQARRERDAIARGEMLARDAIWQGEESGR